MNIQEEGHAPSDLLKVRKIKQVIRIMQRWIYRNVIIIPGRPYPTLKLQI
jgi:hypothetical protein